MDAIQALSTDAGRASEREEDAQEGRSRCGSFGQGPLCASQLRARAAAPVLARLVASRVGYVQFRQGGDPFGQGQGLQVSSLFIGAAIMYWQVNRFIHDWTGSPVSVVSHAPDGTLVLICSSQYDEYLDAVTSGEETNRFNEDPTCAYIPGTGIANWGSGLENFGVFCEYDVTRFPLTSLAWYTGYHCWLSKPSKPANG